MTLRSVCGQGELDELLAEREQINSRIQEILDQQTDPWGIKVVLVELKHIDLPQEMQRAMAKQAEAERERRAKIIHAEGEFQASQKLADAAGVIGKQPMALQLRLSAEPGRNRSEKNSTTIFPVPIDLLSPFLKKDTNPHVDGSPLCAANLTRSVLIISDGITRQKKRRGTASRAPTFLP